MATLKMRSHSSNFSKSSFYKKQKAPIMSNFNDLFLSSSHYSNTIVKGEEFKGKTNYIDKNKKNLKNFFADRLPSQELGLREKKKQYSPAQIYNFRRRQKESQSKTQIVLKDSFQLEKDDSPGKEDIRKINQTFYITDKNIQFKRNNFGSSKKRKAVYSPESRFRGTQSFSLKQSRILKKQVYQTVFGPDKSSTPVRKKKAIFKPCSQKLSKTTSVLRKNSQSQQNQQKFNILLRKISNYAVALKNNSGEIDVLKEQLQRFHDEENVREAYQNQIEQDLIKWVKKLSFSYKQEVIGKEKIESVQELSKMNLKFFEQLKKHKCNRLKTRQKILSQNSNGQSEKSSRKNSLMITINQESIRPGESVLKTGTGRGEKQHEHRQIIPFSEHVPMKQKLANFSQHLLKVIQAAPIFGIQTEDLFAALWKVREPFELEGSYVFFKAIKKGEIDIVKKFIERNRQFLYQIDKRNRTTLICAVISQQSQMVQYLIKQGINISHKCENKKTAIQYAFSRQNVQIVKMLLQAGADPWSNDFYKFDLKKCSEDCRILIKNARKVSIGFQLNTRPKKKLEFWLSNKTKIQEQSIFYFS